MPETLKPIYFIKEHKVGVTATALAATAVSLTAYWWLKKHGDDQPETVPEIEMILSEVGQRRDDGFSLPIDGADLTAAIGKNKVAALTDELEETIIQNPELEIVDQEGNKLSLLLSYLRSFANHQK